MNIRKTFARVLVIVLVFAAKSFAQGGPPMIGDDPGTPGSGKWEINIAYPQVQTEKSISMDLGYLDLNYGLGDNIELTYQGGFLVARNDGQSWQRGWDDSLFGVKWRFFDQETRGVDMSVYPQLGFNTTSSFAKAGLVEAGRSFFFPVEIARTIGKWELDGEAGYQYYEHDRGQWAGGPIIGCLLNDRVELIAEARMVCDQDFRSNDLILDAGARVNLVDHVQFLFAMGRGLRNDDDSPHLYLYAGVGLHF